MTHHNDRESKMTKKWAVIFTFFFILCGLCVADEVPQSNKLPNGLYGCNWGTSLEDCQAILRKQGKDFKLENKSDAKNIETILVCGAGGWSDVNRINKLILFENKLTTVICGDLPSGYSFDYLLKKFGTPKKKDIKTNQITYTWDDGYTNLQFTTINILNLPPIYLMVSNVGSINNSHGDEGVILVRGIAEPKGVGITGYNFYVSTSKDKDFKKVNAYRVPSIAGEYRISQLKAGIIYYVCFSYADSAGVSKSAPSHPVSLTAQVDETSANVDIGSSSISQNK